MKNIQHIAYFTVGEDINNPLLRRQVLELLYEIKLNNPRLVITLFSFLAVHTILNHRASLRQAREFLESAGIKLRIIPSFVPWPFPQFLFHKTDVGYRPYSIWTRLAAKSLGLVVWPVMLYYYFFHGVRVFHCRSYPPAYAAILFKQLFSKTKVIFDPRSDFPEENVTAGNWEEGDDNFVFWKRAEAEILKSADAIACIAPSYLRTYRAISADSNYFLVPNNVDINKFSRKYDVRVTMRRELNISEDEIVICYLGALGTSSWNSTTTYVDAMKCFCASGTKFHFMFIVPKHSKVILDAELLSGDITAKVTTLNVSDEDVPKYLWASDYGLQLHPRLTIRTGTKIGEYLAAGLPVIINRNAIGAADLVNEWHVGVIINSGARDIIDSQDKDLLCSLSTGPELVKWSSDVSDFAKSYFGNTGIAAEYSKQYDHLNNMLTVAPTKVGRI